MVKFLTRKRRTFLVIFYGRVTVSTIRFIEQGKVIQIIFVVSRHREIL